jgi:hypothetical protein
LSIDHVEFLGKSASNKNPLYNPMNSKFIRKDMDVNECDSD